MSQSDKDLNNEDSELEESLPATEDSNEQDLNPALKGDDSISKVENSASDEDVADSEDEEDDQEATPMTFLEHLEELRKCFVKILIACVVGFLACYSFAKPLFSLLMAPLVAVLPDNSTLIFTSLPEGFFTYLKVAFVAGIFVVSPYIFSQIWGFIAPGLYDHERKWMIPLAFISAFFFVGGAMFGYYVVFPFGCEFFMGFADEFIRPMPTLREYLAFSLKLLFAFGVIFELPLFIFFLARLGVVTHTWLRAKRKYAILLSFVVSAILTPPDVVTQTFMALPLIILYEIGIWIAYFFGKQKDNKEDVAQEDDSLTEETKESSVEKNDVDDSKKKDHKSDYDEDLIEM